MNKTIVTNFHNQYFSRELVDSQYHQQNEHKFVDLSLYSM